MQEESFKYLSHRAGRLGYSLNWLPMETLIMLLKFQSQNEIFICQQFECWSLKLSDPGCYLLTHSE